MGFLDDARKKLSEAVDKHGDTIDRGIDRATQAASDLDRKRTGGKHADTITKGAAKAREGLDKLGGRGDEDLRGPTGRRPGDDPTGGTAR